MHEEKWLAGQFEANRGRLKAHAPPAEVLTEAHLAESFGIAAHVAQEEGGLLVVADRPLPEA